MFSQVLEIVLTIAHREGTARRHAYLTLEHLRTRCPRSRTARAISARAALTCRSCGADLDEDCLNSEVEQVPRGREK